MDFTHLRPTFAARPPTEPGTAHTPAPSPVFLDSAEQRTLDALPQLIHLTNGSSGYFNAAWRAYTSPAHHTAAHTHQWLDSLHPLDLPGVERQWRQAFCDGNTLHMECRLRHHSGDYRWFMLLGQAQPHAPNGTQQWYLTATDIHERILGEAALTENSRLQTNMLDVSVDCIKLLRPDGTLTHMNLSGRNALGVPQGDSGFGLTWLNLLPPEIRQRGQRALQQARNGKNARFAGKSVTPGRKPQYWDNILTPMTTPQGQTSGILCVSRDVTLQRDAEIRLRTASERDELTGIYNRRYFKAKLRQCLKKAHEKNLCVGLLLMDLDHFKHINDTLGHAAGDHLLRKLSRRISTVLEGSPHIFARLGGDEFAVIAPNLHSEKELLDLAQAIHDQIQAPITYAGKAINGGMSIGAAMSPRDGADQPTLLKCADTALNHLKANGRGGARLFQAEMMTATLRSAAQLALARQIVHDQIIVPYYQPKVDLKTNQLVGFEALLRWQHPQHGLQTPGAIEEAFNDYALASHIGDLIQNHVFADISRWTTQGLAVVPVSINAAPVEFLRDDFAEHMLARLARHHTPVHLVEVEITEHMLSGRGSSYVIRALTKLKQAGIRVALDDFGTGHSSFAHLRDYPVDCLKIDCDFVHRMTNEHAIHAIVNAITQLGPNLGMDIVAEGIESELQRKILLETGCHLGQGFLFSKAISAAAAEQLLICGLPTHAGHPRT